MQNLIANFLFFFFQNEKKVEPSAGKGSPWSLGERGCPKRGYYVRKAKPASLLFVILPLFPRATVLRPWCARRAVLASMSHSTVHKAAIKQPIFPISINQNGSTPCSELAGLAICNFFFWVRWVLKLMDSSYPFPVPQLGILHPCASETQSGLGNLLPTAKDGHVSR